MMVSKAANGETLNGIPHGDPVASECLSNYKKKDGYSDINKHSKL